MPILNRVCQLLLWTHPSVNSVLYYGKDLFFIARLELECCTIHMHSHKVTTFSSTTVLKSVNFKNLEAEYLRNKQELDLNYLTSLSFLLGARTRISEI